MPGFFDRRIFSAHDCNQHKMKIRTCLIFVKTLSPHTHPPKLTAHRKEAVVPAHSNTIPQGEMVDYF